MNVDLHLPKPYPLQLEIMRHPAKRKVIAAGRRGGKTVMAALMAIESLLAGKRVLLSSTSQDQADVFWAYATRWLAPLTVGKLAKKNEVKRTIHFLDGMLTVKTGRDPDSLRGAFADLLVLDECAYLDPAAWYEVGAPMLLDGDGDAVFISSPKRRNWFFDLYGRAIADSSGRWAGWNFPSTANPHLPKHALSEMVADMTEDSYRQEILAEFLEGAGAVFRNIDTVTTVTPPVEPYKGRFIAGLDWAMTDDYTVITVMDADNQQMVDVDRFNGVDWNLQRGRLANMHAKWGIRAIIAEHNSIGGPNIEELQRQGIPVKAFVTTGTSKPPLIESLVLAIERGEIELLNDPILRHELMAFERTVTASGRSQYKAPKGLHDDMVISLALAWWGVTNEVPLRITQNVFYD